MNRFLTWILGIGLAVGLAAILIVLFLRGRQEAAADAKQENPPAAPSRMNTENGQTFVALDAAAQSRSGIETNVLRGTTQRQELRANAVVLSVQNLTELRGNYLTSEAQVDKAKAALAVSQPAYERLKQLYEDNQNAAAKAVQEAEGSWHSDEVTLRAASNAVQSNETLARQTWGEVVSKWLVEGSPAFDRILTQKDLLLQVSFFSSATSAMPETILVQSPNGKIQRAQFVSSYPSVDPRIQNPSFLYLTPATTDLVPGMSLIALLAMGRPAAGVAVPTNAIVWWQGKAWAYVQTAPDRFARREVTTETPVSNGFFVAANLTPGEKIVVRGGQQLLSEEFRSQIQVLSDSE